MTDTPWATSPLSSSIRSTDAVFPRSAARPWQERLHRLFAHSKTLRGLTVGLLAQIELLIQSGHKPRDVVRLIRTVRRERESLLSGNEAFAIYSLARAQSALPGEMAEVGVYQGCSAKLISLAAQGPKLHLFDTFAGLPEPVGRERRAMGRGHYAASLQAVQSYLSDQPNIVFHQGLFSGENNPCAETRFSFVHIDVDLKEGTLACLEFFYPRMVPGGIIVTHDYSYLSGVRDAFEIFLATRPEHVIELPSSQAMIVKT